MLDASVTMSWCFEDETTPYTEAALDRLVGATAVVPAIWPLEVANVLLLAERRGRLTEAQSARFVELLGALPIVIDQRAMGSTFGSVLPLGRQHGFPPTTRPIWNWPPGWGCSWPRKTTGSSRRLPPSALQFCTSPERSGSRLLIRREQRRDRRGEPLAPRF